MPITIGVPRETYPGESRTAMTPRGMEMLSKKGVQFLVEPGAGFLSGIADADYVAKGARIAANRAEVFRGSDLVVQVRSLGANPEEGKSDIALMKSGQALVGYCEPLSAPQEAAALAKAGVSAFSMELMPRITRAQSMDSLSSMASIAGYKAVLIAAENLPRFFPMMMTAAGSIPAARVLVLGAGVAGLQAIATARRLGAVVSAYDVRSAVKEQIESLGAKFVELGLDAAQAEGTGGYAKAQSEEFLKRQRELLGEVVRQHDVVITTAAVPGMKAPILLTREMMRGMAYGSVVVDIAAERGGNCEVTEPGASVVVDGVTVIGPLNIPSSVPQHASLMYSRNIATFLNHLINKEGDLVVNREDEITRETLVTFGGEVVHARVKPLLGLA